MLLLYQPPNTADNQSFSLMAALWASRYGVHCRIIDKRPIEILKGQADGIQARSLEIFESFGFVERVERECHMSVEMCFWVGRCKTVNRKEVAEKDC